MAPAVVEAHNAVEAVRSEDITVLFLANPPVNALNWNLRSALLDALRQADNDPGVRAVVLASNGRAFSAGADIAEFKAPPRLPVLLDVLDYMDRMSKPVVAAIDGPALGGGLELALACDARMATARSTLGLPEVTLGLLPGAGGGQRIVRLMDGVEALGFVASGRVVPADEARDSGLVDIVVSQGELLDQSIARARELGGAPGRMVLSQTGVDPGSLPRLEEAAEALVAKQRATPELLAIIDGLRNAHSKPFSECCAIDQQAFQRLRQSPRSRALRHAFLAERQNAKATRHATRDNVPPIERVAVVGGGTMGCGIAMAFADAGHAVCVIETDDAAARKTKERITAAYAASVRRARLSDAEMHARLARVTTSSDLESTTATADLVIEAAYEDLQVKREIFATLNRVAKAGAILATNTSYLDVNEIASATDRPGQVLGLHFFSPANLMRLVEVVRGEKTSEETLGAACDLVKRLNKTPVVVGVCHGFVGNRMMQRRSEQVDRMLLQGATPEQIDRVLMDFGFRMGPCAMSDLSGLDISWRMRRALSRRAPVADTLCEAGRLGQKSGVGYYRYPEPSGKGMPDPDLDAILAAVSEREGVQRRPIQDGEILERLIFPMINEGVKLLAEGIVARASDIDLIWLHGYNWPRHKGGPMHFGSECGGRTIAERLDHYARSTGEKTLAPASGLLDL